MIKSKDCWRLLMAIFAILLLLSIEKADSRKMAESGDDGQLAVQFEKLVEEKQMKVHKMDAQNMTLYVLLMIVIVLTAWLFKHRRFRFIHETGVTMVYGLFVGMIIHFAVKAPPNDAIDVKPINQSAAFKDPPTFVRMRIPFRNNGKNGTFHYKLSSESFGSKDSLSENSHNVMETHRHFFRNISTIMMFAFLGTTLSCVVVGYLTYAISRAAGFMISPQETLFFGALISATDPVTVLAVFNDLGVEGDLFAVVFGSLIGCISAALTKFTRITEYPLLESSLFLLMSYLSFLMAQALEMTGIVAVLFCGMTQAHYTFNNLSADSKVRTKQFFEVMNFLSEQFIFSYIGVSMFTSNAHNFKPAFISGSFFAILVGRAIFVYPFSMLINLKRKPKIPWNHMHMLLFSGLRGAIAFALAVRNTSTDARKAIYSTTSLIVICTVIFNGGFASQMIAWLKIKCGSEAVAHDLQLQKPSSPSEPGGTIPQNSDGSTTDSSNKRPRQGTNPWDKALLPRKWYNFDSQYMKPLLTHSRPSLMETLPAFMMPLGRILTSTEQLVERSKDKLEEDEGDLVVDAPTDPNSTTIDLSTSTPNPPINSTANQ